MKLFATGNRLVLTEADRLVSGSINIYTCEFTFDESWGEYMPTAVFESGGKSVEMAVIDNVCQVPFELLTPNARIRVGIYGISGDKRRPTTYAEWMPVERGTETGGAAQTPPDPTVYEQLLQAINEGRLTGPQGPKGDQGERGEQGPKGDGSLVKAGTRICWGGTLKRAAVDLWDNAENTPDAAPTLWEDVLYRDGYRVIPSVITAGTAFAMDELGWWGGKLYKSKLAANVYTPEQYPAGWEVQP